MSERINDGGPAFPATVSFDRDTGEMIPHQFGGSDFKTLGLSLRDYFAAKAMPVAIQSLDNPRNDPCDAPFDWWSEKVSSDMLLAAKFAYAMADAMLAAREVTK